MIKRFEDTYLYGIIIIIFDNYSSFIYIVFRYEPYILKTIACTFVDKVHYTNSFLGNIVENIHNCHVYILNR